MFSKLDIPNLPKLPNFPKIDGPVKLTEDIISQIGKIVDGGAGIVNSTIDNIPFFGSVETSIQYDHQKYDEKHYFLIPSPKSKRGFVVYVIRALPDTVPPINDLPKQRWVHLPSDHALPMLRDVLIAQSKAKHTQNDGKDPSGIDKIIDEIDKAESELFGGLLAIGGLVAFVNPVAGAAIAAKALIPSVGMMLSKHGLKFASETVSQIELSRKLKAAKKDVEKQFKSGAVNKVINPLLAQLTLEDDIEWLANPDGLSFQSDDVDLTPKDFERLLDLTQQATLEVCAVSYTHLTLPTTPYV